MQKIWIILKSEFWRRIRTKGFVLSTLLAPVGLLALMVAPSLLAAYATSGGGGGPSVVAVVDETGRLLPRLQQQAGDAYRFEARPGTPADSLRRAVRAGDYDGFLLLPAALMKGQGKARYYSAQSGGLTERERLSSFIEEAVRAERLDQQGTSAEVRALLEASVPLEMRRLTAEGEESGSGALLSVLGLFLGFAIYFMTYLYGQFVMQGVIEEKASRVVEVVVSSVRPFQLLMGKVLGIGAMALVQVVLWSVLVVAGLAFAGPVVALFLDPADLELPSGASQEAMLEASGITLPTLPLSLMVWFVLFFVGGYLLYSSLFAAAGAAVEQQQDAQSLVFPITLPLLIPIMFAMFIVESPGSALAVGLSLVPFFSPILMPVRIAAGAAPLWQVLLAFALLAGTFLVMIWLSARVYRIGILMYGKKASFGELWRWVQHR